MTMSLQQDNRCNQRACAGLETVVASNNREHLTRVLLLSLSTAIYT